MLQVFRTVTTLSGAIRGVEHIWYASLIGWVKMYFQPLNGTGEIFM